MTLDSSSFLISPWARILLVTIIFLFIPLSIMAPHGIVWVIIAGGLTGAYYSFKQSSMPFPKTLVILLLALPIWGLVTTFWSKDPSSSLLVSLKTLTLVCLGFSWCQLTIRLPETDRRLLMKSLIAGLGLGILFLSIDAYLGTPWQIFMKKSGAKAFAQGSLMISLCAWPVCLFLLKNFQSLSSRIYMILGTLVILCGILFQIDCDTSFIALLLGVVAFSDALVLPRFTSVAMRFGIPGAMFLFPFISFFALKPDYIPTYNHFITSSSYIERLYIWNDVATAIVDEKYPTYQKWVGVGMDGSRNHDITHQLRTWPFVDRSGEPHTLTTQRIPVHPHNAVLQLWLELGVVGFLLSILLAYQLISQIFNHTHTRTDRAIGAGLFINAFLIIFVNLGFWQNWWISGLLVVIGLTVGMFKRNNGSLYQNTDK